MTIQVMSVMNIKLNNSSDILFIMHKHNYLIKLKHKHV